MRKKILIVLGVILLVLIVYVVYLVLPHKRHFKSVWIRTSSGNADYEYLGYTGLLKCYIDSDTDLQKILEDNDETYQDSIGEQTLRVRFIGFRIYRTDNSGIFVSYPIPVFRYVGEDTEQ